MHQFSLSVGPVAATVLTAFLILLTFYCYKARTSGLSCVLDDPDSQAIAPAITSNYPEEMEDLTPEEHNSSVHPSKEGAPVVAQVGVTSGSGGDPSSFGVVSPYRMNPSYLRPRPIGGAESSDDHGYSTMTPMSEVLLPIHHANADVVNDAGTVVISPYKMNPGYSRPGPIGGASSSVAGAVASSIATASEVASPIRALTSTSSPENAIDVTLSDGELSSPTNEGDKTKSIQNILGPNETILPKKDSLLLEGPNTIVVSATVHQPNE